MAVLSSYIYMYNSVIMYNVQCMFWFCREPTCKLKFKGQVNILCITIAQQVYKLYTSMCASRSRARAMHMQQDLAGLMFMHVMMLYSKNTTVYSICVCNS